MTSYDEKINRLFYYWLLTSFTLILVMVLVGGLTRLTDSGLSITQWELFKGILPPLTNEQWNIYFVKYKEIPQYKLLNEGMSLSQFKIIFYWEYIHRFLGRLIGIFFLIPLLYFSFKKEVNKKNLLVCYLIFFLITTQGIVGWYMVQSGLVNNVTVSHYRLSLHLSLAFIIISLIFWILLNIKNRTNVNFFSRKKQSYIFYFLIFLVYLQVAIGAFVSGLDAGKIYQTWPLMNYSYFPTDVIIFSFKDLLDFNNHSLVQFYHRNFAYLITIYIIAIGFFIFKKNLEKIYNSFYIVVFFLILQIFLGVITLVSGLHIYLASTHQICSLLLILSVINLHYNYIK